MDSVKYLFNKKRRITAKFWKSLVPKTMIAARYISTSKSFPIKVSAIARIALPKNPLIKTFILKLLLIVAAKPPKTESSPARIAIAMYGVYVAGIPVGTERPRDTPINNERIIISIYISSLFVEGAL